MMSDIPQPGWWVRVRSGRMYVAGQVVGIDCDDSGDGAAVEIELRGTGRRRFTRAGHEWMSEFGIHGKRRWAIEHRQGDD